MKITRVFTTGLLISVMGLSACTTPPQAESTFTQDNGSAQQTDTSTQAVAQEAACTLVRNGFGSPGKINLRVEEVANGLEVPWGIAFLPNRDMLVTERPGRVRLVRNGKLQPQPVATINVSDSGEGGLLGIAAHPDFANNRFFYVYYTATRNNSPVNLVERWRLDENGKAKSDRIILNNIPVARFHNGGRIRFGPDGMLYIGTGDARDPNLSQNTKSLAGKILRVTPDGQIPSDKLLCF